MSRVLYTIANTFRLFFIFTDFLFRLYYLSKFKDFALKKFVLMSYHAVVKKSCQFLYWELFYVHSIIYSILNMLWVCRVLLRSQFFLKNFSSSFCITHHFFTESARIPECRTQCWIFSWRSPPGPSPRSHWFPPLYSLTNQRAGFKQVDQWAAGFQIPFVPHWPV